MANRVHWPVQSRTRELKTIAAILGILGNTTPANGTFNVVNGGDGIKSFARTGTGQYTVTLEDGYVECVGLSLNLEAAVAVDLIPQVVSRDVKTAKTVVFVLNTGASPTDTANGVQQYVHFYLRCKNSGVK